MAGIVGVCSDISAIKESQQRLEYQAQHDSLTGLPNRLMLGRLAEHSIMPVARILRWLCCCSIWIVSRTSTIAMAMQRAMSF